MTSVFPTTFPSPVPRVWLALPSFMHRVIRRRFNFALGLMFCGLMLQSSAVGAEFGSAREHQIKAAFVYNFAKFVEWPAPRFETTNSPVIIGVLGKTAINTALEAVVKNRKINDREILVKPVATAAEARATHLIFLPAEEDKQFEVLLTSLAGSGVLTVGESASFAKAGGMINFVLDEDKDKVRFEINLEPVEQAGLKLSAQLQKLAKTVRRKS